MGALEDTVQLVWSELLWVLGKLCWNALLLSVVLEVQNSGLLDGARIGQGLIAEEDLGCFTGLDLRWASSTLNSFLGFINWNEVGGVDSSMKRRDEDWSVSSGIRIGKDD